MKAKSPTKKNSWSRRPFFSPRQLLTADQLNQGLDDELQRQRLLNRAVLGYGVVFGFGLDVDDDGELRIVNGCIDVSCGLALDRHGRMLHWPGGPIGISDLAGDPPDCKGHYTLCVHYCEDPPEVDKCQPISGDNWRDQGVVFSLTRGCEKVDRHCPDHPDCVCLTHDDYLCQRTGGMVGPDTIDPSEDLAWACKEPGSLCPTNCGTLLYDPRSEVCVPIACVEICDVANETDRKEQQDPYKGKDQEEVPTEPECEPCFSFCSCRPDSCSVRPYVYRNRLLYELLNCCDVELPRVRWVSWIAWLESWEPPVPWAEFEDRIVSNREGFQLWFSKRVRTDTLHPGSIFMTAIYEERRSDYWMAQRVPLNALEPLDVDGDFAAGVRLVPTQEWIEAEITGTRSTLFEGARFEITVRGQLIRDDCNQMLDARPLDIDDHARCQARPGDDFVTVFQVGAREPDKDDYDKSPYERPEGETR